MRREEVQAMALQEVIVVSVPVSDQDRARAFYVDTLGFELVREDTSVPGIRWVQVAPEGGTVSLSLVTWFETMPPGSMRGLVFTSDDVEAEYEALTAKGVRFDGPPEPQPYAPGGEAVCYDPDGNMLVLQQA